MSKPALALTATCPLSVRVGEGVTFTLHLTNNTAAPLRRVLLQARLSGGLRHPEGAQVEAVLPVLAPGESKPVPLNTVASQAGRQVLTATVSAPGVDPLSVEAAVDVLEAATPAPVPRTVIGSPEVRPGAATPTPAAPTALPPAPSRSRSKSQLTCRGQRVEMGALGCRRWTRCGRKPISRCPPRAEPRAADEVQEGTKNAQSSIFNFSGRFCLPNGTAVGNLCRILPSASRTHGPPGHEGRWLGEGTPRFSFPEPAPNRLAQTGRATRQAPGLDRMAAFWFSRLGPEEN